jgi:hypothetical protein
MPKADQQASKNARRRTKVKGRAEARESFAGVPRAVMNTRKYRLLSAPAKVLLFELCRQHNGFNNGDLCAAWGIVKDRGCGSHTTVQKATNELTRVGMIEMTERGGRHRPNLYALTWKAWDDCGIKVSFSPTRSPSGLWKDSEASQPTERHSLEIENAYPRNRQRLPDKQANWSNPECAP